MLKLVRRRITIMIYCTSNTVFTYDDTKYRNVTFTWLVDFKPACIRCCQLIFGKVPFKLRTSIFSYVFVIKVCCRSVLIILQYYLLLHKRICRHFSENLASLQIWIRLKFKPLFSPILKKKQYNRKDSKRFKCKN